MDYTCNSNDAVAHGRTSMLDAKDSEFPNSLTPLEREVLYQILLELKNDLKEHERRLDSLERNESMPVTLSAKGATLTSSWRFALALILIAASVSIAYMYRPIARTNVNPITVGNILDRNRTFTSLGSSGVPNT